jgi:hypothetical protein
MQTFLAILDFISRVISLALAIGAVIGFALKSWIEQWIKARFKRQLDLELEERKAGFAAALEEKKAEFARLLGTETETLKAKFTRDLEHEKRALDDKFRREERFTEGAASYYEAFSQEYQKFFITLQLARGNLFEEYPDTRKEMMGQLTIQLLAIQGKLMEKELYVDIAIRQRAAELFTGLVDFMKDNAADDARYNALSQKQGEIAASLLFDIRGRVF